MTLTAMPQVEQGSDQWHTLRRGIVTASVVGRLITHKPRNAYDYDCPACERPAGEDCRNLQKGRDGSTLTPHAARSEVCRQDTSPQPLVVADGDDARTLTATLVAERVTGFTESTPISRDMNRGVWSESYARDLYSEHYAPVTEVGFMRRDEDGWTLGYSPDGLVGDDGLIEIKAPRSKTQLLTVLSDQVPAFYMAQCQAGLLVSGRKWLDFVSYAGGMHLYVTRVLPDPEWFAAIESACRTFDTNATAMASDYLKRVKGRPLAPRIDFDLEVI